MENFIINTVFSGAIGAIVIFILERYFRKRDEKFKTLVNFVKYRNNLGSDEFLSSINSICIIFGRNKNVKKAIVELCKSLQEFIRNENVVNHNLYLVYYYSAKSIFLKPIDEYSFNNLIFVRVENNQ